MVHRMNFTQIIIIVLLVIVSIGYIIYLLNKNKEKLKNINLKKWIKEKRKVIKKEELKKVKSKIYLVVAILIIVLIIAIIQVKNYNEDLQQCYVIAKQELGWNSFQSLIDKHPILKSSFEEKAYQELYKAMDEEIEKIKNGDYGTEEESFNWYNEADKNKVDKEYKDKIKEKQQLIELYRMINTINRKYIKNGQYREAFSELNDIRNAYGLCKEGQKIAKKEQDKIEDKAIEQVVQIAQDRISKGDYSSTKSILEDFKHLKNETITNLYKTCEQKVEEEKKAEEERKKQEEQARIKKERFDYEVYCYFNLIAVKQNLTSDDVAYSKCASKFGITKAQAKQSYQTVNSKGGWWYQDEYPDIFEKYAKQY